VTCDRDRVTERAVYEEIYREMIGRAHDRLGIRLRNEPPLVVERRMSLASNPGLAHVPESLSGLYVHDGRGNGSIHILSELPRPRIAAILSHELAHAWQAENAPEPQSDRVREGFAEWVAWRLLEGVPGGEAEREIIHARTDVYGDGFRLFARLERESGADSALRWAQGARSWSAANARE
jgi:hypothetical protein